MVHFLFWAAQTSKKENTCKRESEIDLAICGSTLFVFLASLTLELQSLVVSVTMISFLY